MLLPIYTRYLTPADYGIVNSMNVLLTILTIFYTMAIERSIYRLYFDYKTKEDKKAFLGNIFFTMILNAFLILAIILIGKSVVANVYKSIPFYPYYVYIIATGFLSVFGIIPLIYFQVEEKAGKFILVTLSQFVISSALIIYFIVYEGKGASGMLLGNLVSTIIFLPLFIIVISRVVNFRLKYEIIRESMFYSVPLVPMMLSVWVLNLSDRIFIERYYSLKDVGIYSIAYKMSEILLVFTTAFSKAYDPIFFKIANQDNQIDAKNKLSKYNKFYSIVLILGALGISLFSKEFILLLDEKYESAIKLVPMIIIGVLFGQVGGIFNMSIYQAKKTTWIMLLAVCAAIMNIILNWLFVPKYGPFGAAFSTTISFIFFFILKFVYSKKSYFIPFLWKELGVYFVFSVIIAGIFYFINVNFWLSIFLKVIVMVFAITMISINNLETIRLLLQKKKKVITTNNF